MTRFSACALAAMLLAAPHVSAQTVSQRGFVEIGGTLFPRDAPRDATNAVLDLLVREEVFATPSSWLQLAGGVDLRGNTHGQVERSWRVDLDDRRLLRPTLGIRRLAATLTHGPITVDLGKQFIRWGKADIVTPTDHFAPRDFINVVDNGFLAVAGARAVVQAGNETVDAVWLPRFTPSRLPLIEQRWTVLPDSALAYELIQADPHLPGRDQVGLRWGHTGGGYELSASVFDGVNHLPNIVSVPVPVPGGPPAFSIAREYPRLRSYGVDVAVPNRWFTVKGEAATFQSLERNSDDYMLYVVQVERQTGEWLLLAGYAGELVTERRVASPFAPDRGLTRAIVGRASYTLDSNRSLALEGAVRQNGDGVYAKGEYSQARGQHWRTTVTGVVIAGAADDFLGQYHRNSHVVVSLRYSF